MEFLKNAGALLGAIILGIAGIWAIADQAMSRTLYFRFGIDFGREESPVLFYAVLAVEALFVAGCFVYAFFEAQKLVAPKPVAPIED